VDQALSYKITAPGQAERRDPGATRTVLVEQLEIADLDTFMRRILAEAAAEPPMSRTLLRRDYETALNLLQRASEAVPILLQQCQALDTELREVRQQSEKDLHAANKVTDQWHQLALALKAKIDENDREITALRERIEAAEARFAAGEQQADAVRQQASTAIGIATLFHDRIVEAFGVGSQAHAAMDLLAKGGLDGRPGASDEQADRPAD
jgi:hypothetical protein